MQRIFLRLTFVFIALSGNLAFAGDPSQLGGIETLGDDPLQGKLPAPPQPGKPRAKPSGLTLEFDASWGGGSGYRPASLRVTPLQALSAPRELTIQVSGAVQPTVTQQLELPPGMAGAKAVLSLPQQGPWSTVLLEVYEDGKRIDELCVPEDLNEAQQYRSGFGTYLLYGNGRRGAPNAVMLLGFSDAQVQAATTTLQSFFNIYNGGGEGVCSFVFADVSDAQRTAIQPGVPAVNKFMIATSTPLTLVPALKSGQFLPDRWIDNSSIDHFVLSLDEAKKLSKLHPVEWSAIRKAVAAGATMCVYGIDKKWDKLEELEALVDFPGSQPSEIHDQRSPSWTSPDDSFRMQSESRPVSAPNIYGFSAPDGDDPPESPPAAKIQIRSSLGGMLTRLSGPAPAFLIRPFYRGRVMAVAADTPAEAVDFVKARLIGSAGGRKLRWAERHGLFLDPRALSANKGDFWQFTIPGVGLTPVTQFVVLITLFVLAIGPVNYWLLRRWQRLNLLVITVPASAAIVTGALLLYAIVGDGLGVRARVRSFTEIDCRSGEAVCWSRLSFYAGLSPSSGLEFPTDVAVYPFQQESIEVMRSAPQHEVTWLPGFNAPTREPLTQHWSKDWLPGRTPTQFITVRVRKTTARLDIAPAGGANGGLSVVNRLATRIQQIVATDAMGNYYRGGELADSSEGTLAPVAKDDALKEIRKTLSENDLQLPPGAQPDAFQDASEYRRRNFNRYSYPAPATYAWNQSVLQRDGVLEQSLREWSTKLPPRSFVAIVDRSPEVVVGVESAHEEASLHVVAGHW